MSTTARPTKLWKYSKRHLKGANIHNAAMENELQYRLKAMDTLRVEAERRLKYIAHIL